jgi:hypothetical protein
MHAWKERRKEKKKRKERGGKTQIQYTYLSNKEIHCIFKTEIIMKQVLITSPQWLKHSE